MNWRMTDRLRQICRSHRCAGLVTLANGKEAAADRRIDRPLGVDTAAVESEGGGETKAN
jgi:hypothetical protein